MKKILIYNWIPFDETENKGGGVTVYTRNLVENLIKDKECQIFFLSSGRAYDYKRKDVYIESTNNIFGDLCKSFQIVNSPVLSSANLSFPYPDAYLNDIILFNIVHKFIKEQNGFDVIHFQNFEGLSLKVFELKKYFPNTKFLYSLHNYYLFCPQVMLWHNNTENCKANGCGEACIECMPKNVYKSKVILNQKINYYREHGSKNNIKSALSSLQKIVEGVYELYGKYLKKDYSTHKKAAYKQNFEQFLKKNIEYANLYIDEFFAVSERVAEIAIEKGIAKEKVHVSYIGTEVAKHQMMHSAYAYDGKVFRISYLGYMRKMKGFYFLLEALENMQPELAKKIGIRFAAKITDLEAQKRIEMLKNKFAEVVLYDGYTHQQLPQILENVQLGIVPVMWEDNLPQVAIEMKSFGIPILTSDLGGAKELTASNSFVFNAGNLDDFIQKIQYFVDNPERLQDYWKTPVKLVTMEEHISKLMEYYR